MLIDFSTLFNSARIIRQMTHTFTPVTYRRRNCKKATLSLVFMIFAHAVEINVFQTTFSCMYA